VIDYINQHIILQDGVIEHVLSDKIEYYWSDDYSANFYIFLASLGFISITYSENELEVLLPQIQESYAVLDFKNLYCSKKVKSIIKKQNLEIHFDTNFQEIADLIQESYGDSWLTKKYINTLIESKEIDSDFTATTVYIKKDNKIIAAEIGYFINKTYTSLSGFTNRDKKYNSFGTAQLVLLAKYLEKNNFAFWNLGHPYMDYKIKLGAKVLKRKDFLLRWNKEVFKLK